MKAYKIAYTRIGDNESWAGWKIAGNSSLLPADLKDEYAKIQGNNSTTKATGSLYDAAPEVLEYISSSKAVFLSKLKYGMMDQEKDPRNSMMADGLIFPYSENQSLYKSAEELLRISDESFNNNLKITTLYQEKIARNENTENLATDDYFTIFGDFSLELIDLDYNRVYFDVFSNKSILYDLLKCVFWILTDKSADTLYLVYDGTETDYRNIIYFLLKTIPYSLKIDFSFRTMEIPGSKPTKFAFSKEIPEDKRYFSILTGENNVISQFKLNTRWENYDFITFYPEHYGDNDTKNYFDLLDKEMQELGNANSVDLKFIKVAHELVIEEFFQDHGELSDLELCKKLLKFLMLPYNNAKIDGHISKYLEMIIDRGIELNDSMQERLQAKLKLTTFESLQNIGYSYNAIIMIKSKKRIREFKYLYSLRDNEKLYTTMREKILSKSGGGEFIDEYYGEYYGNVCVMDSAALRSFCYETKDLTNRGKINKFIADQAMRFGYDIVRKFYNSELSLDKEFDRYVKFVRDVMPQSNDSLNRIINEVRIYFWENFDFSAFSYDLREDYLCMMYRTNVICAAVIELIKVFDEIRKHSVTVVQRLRKTIDTAVYTFSEEDRLAVFVEFQKQCLMRCKKERNLDFWINTANLTANNVISFIIDNDVSVFTDINLFEHCYINSVYFSEDKNIDRFLRQLAAYIEKNNDSELANKLSSSVKNFEKNKKKQERRDKKDKEKSRYIPRFGAKEKNRDNANINTFSLEIEDSQSNIQNCSKITPRYTTEPFKKASIDPSWSKSSEESKDKKSGLLSKLPFGKKKK